MADKTTFSLGNNLDIFHVEKLKQRLDAVLSDGVSLVIKADKVERADTAGLQLFLAVKNKIESKGGHIVWHNPSTTLVEIATLIGVADILNLNQD